MPIGSGRRKIRHYKPLIPPEWEIQPGESLRSFEMFKIYRSLGIDRTIKGVLHFINTPPEKMKQELSRLCRLSSRWDWRERVKKWEQYMEQQILAEELNIRREMNRRLAEHAKSAEMAMMTIIKKYIERYNNNGINFEMIEDEDLFGLVIKACEKLPVIGEFERRVRGEPTEYIKQEMHSTSFEIGIDYDNIEHDELLRLAQQMGFHLNNKSKRLLAQGNDGNQET